MSVKNKQIILENLIYLIIWIIIFISPLLNFREEGTLQWEHIFRNWKMIIPFFIFFLVNNYLLIPYLLKGKRTWFYAAIVFLIVAFLLIFNPFDPIKQHREKDKHMSRPRSEMLQHQQPPRQRKPGPPMFSFPGRNSWLMVLIIVGLNIAIKLLFKSIRDEKQLRELERYSLETELNYLKAQINPHFFMNTLNNIHALIDIDSEKAKDTVIDLSKMMRYVLYEASQKRVLLSKEIEFLKNYIELMKIRYTDRLDLSFTLPESLPEVSLPPLLFLSFIENAFKHGISYRSNSFIHISITIHGEELEFRIRNSIYQGDSEFSTGVGLENITKRLSLLYGKDYYLNFKNKEQQYDVHLIIPLNK
ncbi:histidine kinase [Bacteroidales bacterium OttesenSCG-928-M06]|nr:histidine kinase [Bacteroidales bacterium OttesenSCG-928-M06]